MSKLSSTVIIAKPQHHSLDIFHRLQGTINAGLDRAKVDFPVGLVLDYPYYDRKHKKYCRMQVVVAHYGLISTINGLVPGVTLQHLTAAPHGSMFERDQSDGARYSKSLIHGHLSDPSEESFQAGLPDEFREIITPIRLNVSFWDDTHNSFGNDIVDSAFFLPSLEEIGFDKFGHPQAAEWEYFREHPNFHFRTAEADCISYHSRATSCFLRSTCYDSSREAWVKCADNENPAVTKRSAYFGGDFAPFCTIVQTSYKPPLNKL